MATEDLQRLVVSLEARISSYEKAMKKALGETNKAAKGIENRFKKTNTVLSAQFARLGGVFAGAFSVRALQGFSDAATRIQNSLRVAGLAGEDLTRVYDSLFQSAQRNAAPLETLTTLYGRAALVQNELKISTEELLGFTDSVAVALRVAGTDAQQASGALLQLSQALGSGVVRAEEFNSILEGALPIAQAAAAGLEEAGGSVARLRQLVVDGKISSEAFFRAFEAGSVILDEKVASAEYTVSQGFVRLQNVMTHTVGRLNSVTGASGAVVSALNAIANALEQFEGSRFEKALEGTVSSMSGLQESTRRLVNDPSWSNLYDALFVGSPDSQAEKQTRQWAESIDGLRESLRKLQGTAAQTQQVIPISEALSGRFDDAFSPRVKTVSLDDYAAPTADKGKGKSAAARLNEYERAVRSANEAIAEHRAEQAALASVNPLIEDYGYALDKARIAQNLLNAAERAGLAITPALKQEIETLADAQARSAANGRQMAESFEDVRRQAEEFRDLEKDVMGGFIRDLVEGKSAADALANSLTKIADKLLDMALNSLFSGGGGIGGILGGLFGGFRAGGGPVQAGKSYVVGEKGPELFSPSRSGVIIPNNVAAKTGGAGPSIVYSPVIDARGASVEAVARLEQVLAEDRAAFKSKVVAAVRSAQRDRMV